MAVHASAQQSRRLQVARCQTTAFGRCSGARLQLARHMTQPAPQHQAPPNRQRSVSVSAAKKAAAAAVVAASTAAFPGLQQAVAPLVPAAVAASVACLAVVSLLVRFGRMGCLFGNLLHLMHATAAGRGLWQATGGAPQAYLRFPGRQDIQHEGWHGAVAFDMGAATQGVSHLLQAAQIEGWLKA